MDACLQGCLESGLPPFDGFTIHLADHIPLEQLRALTRAVLEGAYPTSPLFVLDDWHEHDGCIFSASPSTWPTIRGHASSLQKFLYFKTGDFGVAQGIYPKGETFYLRIVIDEDSNAEEGEGALDVTVPADLVNPIVEAFEELGLHPLRQEAKAFFTKRAAD